MTGPQRLIADLNLQPLPAEGGMYSQYFADQFSTAIYFLVQRHDFSALHRLTGVETYHFHGGAALRFLLLYPDGHVERPVLGLETTAGERPALVVPAGVWQGSETKGEWSLVGATMAPGFRPEMFELGDRDDLLSRYPQASVEIERLTRVV
ncbi:MAG TPA: cupin domain-containing protein [Acidimicrobiia bacterium]|nr:cupin domain-containing protein [Acidimicrobiia bacterium]